MSFNLMDLAKGALDQGGVMGKLGGLLGTDEKATGGAIGAALPALIGGMMNKSSSSEGASEMFGMLDKFDGGMLENLGGIFDGGEKQSGMLDMGGGIMKMIFGDKLAGIIEMIGKVTGMKGPSITSLLGFLGPIVMSILGKKKKETGWDIGNFTSAMSDQKSHLAGLDSGMLGNLGLSNLVGSGKDLAGKAAGAVAGGVGDAGRAIGSGVDKAGEMAGEAASGIGNLLKIILPIAALGLLAYLAITMFGGGDKDGDGGNKQQENPAGAVSADGDGGTPMDKFNGMLGGVTDTLDGVKDEASATAALDKLKGFGTQMDSLGIGNLPSAAKQAALGPFRTKLNGILERVYAIPGVEAILKPVVDGLLSKLGG